MTTKLETTSIPTSINATVTPLELLDILLSMSQNVTWTTALDAVERLPAGVTAEKLGVVSVQASMSVKKVVDKVIPAAGLNLSDDWKVNSTVNFSMLAMIGHLIFLLDDSVLTTSGIRARVPYMKSIGGSRNLAEFGMSGNVPAKMNRTTILREWSGRLEGADLIRVRRVMAEKFPLLVIPETSSAEAATGTLMRLPLALISFAIRVALYPFRTLYNLFGILPFIAILLLYTPTRLAIFWALETLIAGVWGIAVLSFKSFAPPTFTNAANSLDTLLKDYAASPAGSSMVQAMDFAQKAYTGAKAFDTTAALEIYESTSEFLLSALEDLPSRMEKAMGAPAVSEASMEEVGGKVLVGGTEADGSSRGERETDAGADTATTAVAMAGKDIDGLGDMEGMAETTTGSVGIMSVDGRRSMGLETEVDEVEERMNMEGMEEEDGGARETEEDMAGGAGKVTELEAAGSASARKEEVT